MTNPRSLWPASPKPLRGPGPKSAPKGRARISSLRQQPAVAMAETIAEIDIFAFTPRIASRYDAVSMHGLDQR